MDDAVVDEKAAADAADVAFVAAGDAAALRRLYERYGRVVYSFAYRLTGDGHAAATTVEDVFVTLWRRAADLNETRAQLTTWLFVVARNRALELVRGSGRSAASLGAVGLPDAGAGPDELDLAADEAQRVAEALAELPEEQLEVLRLAYFDGLSYARVATTLGVSRATVARRVRLALQRLGSLSDTYDLHRRR